MSRICYIVAAASAPCLYFASGDRLLIAADAGYRRLKSAGMVPDLAVGDFDSLGFEPHDCEVIYHKPEKDDTDTMLAIKEGLARGYDKFVLFGALGGRIDHSYANMQALSYIAEHGGRGLMVGEGFAITALKDGKITLSGEKGEPVSVFCTGDRAEGVSIKGLKYSLENAVLESAFPLGVSNEFVGEEAEISVKNGSLLVMWSAEGKDAAEEFCRGE
ncbi:MAG: thiamine diphosphokinase [Oscillospiraceae bacterium]|nr:thiamine diphosphokinase [Oscillospiraceae bacterium]